MQAKPATLVKLTLAVLVAAKMQERQPEILAHNSK